MEEHMQAPSGDLISDGPSSRLSELGIVLPAPPAPLGAYVESSETGNLLFLSGTLPVVNGKLAIAGRLGANLSVKEGQEAARIVSGARWKGRNTGAFKMDLLRRRFLPTIH